MHPPRPALVGAGYLHPLTVQAKMMRQELLQLKAHLERELGTPLLTCRRCWLEVHWVEGHGVSPVTGRTRRPHRKANRPCKAPVASGFRCSTL